MDGGARPSAPAEIQVIEYSFRWQILGNRLEVWADKWLSGDNGWFETISYSYDLDGVWKEDQKNCASLLAFTIVNYLICQLDKDDQNFVAKLHPMGWRLGL